MITRRLAELMSNDDYAEMHLFFRDLEQCFLAGHDFKTSIAIIHVKHCFGMTIDVINSFIKPSNLKYPPNVIFDRIAEEYKKLQCSGEYEARVLGKFHETGR